MPSLPRSTRRRSRRRSPATLGVIGGVVLLLMFLACVATIPLTFSTITGPGGETRRFEATNADEALLPPTWATRETDHAAGDRETSFHMMGTDRLGRDVMIRVLAGGGISLGIGLIAAAIAVSIGTGWGAVAAFCGGRVDAVMMRVVDVLFGLPSILLVVLIAVAVNGILERSGQDLAPIWRQVINVCTLWLAIGMVSWLTVARVIRGQVLSLTAQPFMEACRVMGMGPWRQFRRHLFPNILGPIIVYATLTVPMAILSEAFLSFLGIGVQEPLPSWGNLAADGLGQLNLVRSRWWLLLWPCLFIALTLVSLNCVGEWLRDRLDPVSKVVR